MKLGQTVNFYRPVDKIRKDAEVVSIDGSGPSNAKFLTLQFNEDGVPHRIEEVKHYRDAREGEPFWLLKGSEKAPAGWADAELADDTEVPEAYSVEEVEEVETPQKSKRRR